MSYNRPIKVNRRRKKGVILPALLLLFAALGISTIVALVWQAAEGDALASGPSSSAASSMPPAPSSESEPEPEPEPASEPEPEPGPVVVEGAVPEADPVDAAYFDDAVFVGDSITTGIELYGMMGNTDVLAGTGINLLSIYTAPAVKLEDGSRITIMDGLKAKQYGKVYVLLGGNEVRDEAKEQFLKNYSRFLDDLRELQPDALIYVQSITPVTRVNNYKMDNARIDEFNAALVELCKEKQVYYVNIAESMKDENGMLPDEASPADGMHIGPPYYTKWFNYLMSHTVPQPGDPPRTKEPSEGESEEAARAGTSLQQDKESI